MTTMNYSTEISRFNRVFLLVLLFGVITQSFSPTIPSFFLSNPNSPSSPPSSTAFAREIYFSSPSSVWRMMVLYTSKSLSFTSEDSSKELPKFDAAFAEAIGRSIKKWKQSKSSSVTSSTTSQTTAINPTQMEEVDNKENNEKEETITDTSRESISGEMNLHPDIARYRQEELQKQWKTFQTKVQQRVSTRNPVATMLLTKEVKAFEKQVLEKEMITEKELLRLAEKEAQYFGTKSKDSPIKELLNLFPEIKSMVPKFTRRRDGSLISCQADDDCPQPLTCCPGFLSNGERFCCSGWGERVLVPSYQYLTLKNEIPPPEEERWKDGNRPYQCPN